MGVGLPGKASESKRDSADLQINSKQRCQEINGNGRGLRRKPSEPSTGGGQVRDGETREGFSHCFGVKTNPRITLCGDFTRVKPVLRASSPLFRLVLGIILRPTREKTTRSHRPAGFWSRCQPPGPRCGDQEAWGLSHSAFTPLTPWDSPLRAGHPLPSPTSSRAKSGPNRAQNANQF